MFLVGAAHCGSALPDLLRDDRFAQLPILKSLRKLILLAKWFARPHSCNKYRNLYMSDGIGDKGEGILRYQHIIFNHRDLL